MDIIDIKASELPKDVKFYQFDDLEIAQRVGGDIYRVTLTCKSGTYYQYFIKREDE